MKIATISKSDLFGGGASRVAQVLADAFAEDHPGSVHFCNRPGGGFGGHRLPFSSSEITNKVIRVAQAVSRKVGFAESLPIETASLIKRVLSSGANLAHVHDTTTAVSPLSLHLLSNRLPVVWTIHDASPFTGGCIYPKNCKRFEVGCGRCPQHGEWPLDGLADLTRLHRWLRKQVHSTGRIELITPSRWMSNLAFSSGMLTRRPTIMPNPIDTNVFSPPADKQALRRRLGLPDKGLVLIGVAGDLKDPRKGLADTLKVASALSELGAHLILIGRQDENASEWRRDTRVTVTGFVSDPRKLSEWYGAADAFVYCASMDNQPLTILEAMACGLPTFGYAVGGSGELVSDGQNGFMVPYGDTGRLAASLVEAVDADALARMGASARRYVVENHALPTVTAKHVAFYHALRAEGSHGARIRAT